MYVPFVGLLYLVLAQFSSFFFNVVPILLWSVFTEISIYYCLLQTAMISTISFFLHDKYSDAMLMHFSIYFTWHTLYFVNYYPKCTISKLNIQMSMYMFCLLFVPFIIVCSYENKNISEHTFNYQFQGWLIADAIHYLHHLVWSPKYHICI